MPKGFWEHSREANVGVGSRGFLERKIQHQEIWAAMGRRLSGAEDSMNKSVESYRCAVGMK